LLLACVGVASGRIPLFGGSSLSGRFELPEAFGRLPYLPALATFAGTPLARRYELAFVSDSPADSFNAFVNGMALGAAVVTAGGAAVFIAGRADPYVVAGYGCRVFG
ncbi:translocase, partial [Burkholderia thailandensis]|nr:translocase [Burkholderia thailandensis]